MSINWRDAIEELTSVEVMKINTFDFGVSALLVQLLEVFVYLKLCIAQTIDIWLQLGRKLLELRYNVFISK